MGTEQEQQQDNYLTFTENSLKGTVFFYHETLPAIKYAETCEAWTEKKNIENSREESWFLLYSIVSKKQWSSLRKFARKCESMWKQWIWIYGLHAGSLFHTRTCFYVIVRGALLYIFMAVQLEWLWICDSLLVNYLINLLLFLQWITCAWPATCYRSM